MAARVLNIERWTVMEQGGRFAALGQPEALAADIREFFRPFRAQVEPNLKPIASSN